MVNYQYNPYDPNKPSGPLNTNNFPQQQVNNPMQGLSNVANMYVQALYNQKQHPGAGTSLTNPFSTAKDWASSLFTQPPASGLSSDSAVY